MISAKEAKAISLKAKSREETIARHEEKMHDAVMKVLAQGPYTVALFYHEQTRLSVEIALELAAKYGYRVPHQNEEFIVLAWD